MVLVEGLAWYLAQNHHLEHDVYHYFSLRKLFEINHGGLWLSPWPGSLIFLSLLVWSMPCSPKPGCASGLDAAVMQYQSVLPLALGDGLRLLEPQLFPREKKVPFPLSVGVTCGDVSGAGI